MNARISLAAVLALALAAAGCADNQVSIQMAGICAAPDDAAACTFPESCDVIAGTQLIDVGVTGRLWLVMQLDNQNLNNADPDSYRANSRDAYYTGIEVEYEGVGAPAWSAPMGPFLIRAGGSQTVDVFPIDVSSAGALAAATAIAAAVPVTGAGPPPTYGVYTIIAKVRLTGVYQDQTEWETAQLPIAIQVCNGCLDPLPDCDPVTAGIQPPDVCPNAGQLPASVGECT